MEYRHLGRLGVLVSPLCLGTMNFPTHASEEEAHAVFDRALEHGINFFDTANRYGGDPSKGLTEQILGPSRSSDGGSPRGRAAATRSC